ncbi:hypothetical protein BH10PAT4_BH10PAT4_4930 [soil metagenome]
MIVRNFKHAREWFRQHHKRVILIGVGGLLVLFATIQFRYPTDLLLPFTTIDGLEVGGWSKANAAVTLDTNYRDASTTVYFGSDDNLYGSVKPSDVGVSVKNSDRLKSFEYPWYLRLVPGSLLWAHFVIQPREVSYTHDDAVLSAYINEKFGNDCTVAAKNATLEIIDNKINVENGAPGGTCNIDDVTRLLKGIEPSLTIDNKVTLPFNVISADVGDEIAKALADQIETGIKDGITISFVGTSVLIARDDLVSWLNFSVTDDQIDYSFDANRAKQYLTDAFASKVAVNPGTTTIVTYNFSETSRRTGQSGQTLDIPGTLARVKAYVNGEVETLVPATTPIEPSVAYERSYSTDYVGLAALIQNYATTHSGTYSVALNELSGQYRRATYQGTKSFTTASTYKLYVAYSTLLRIESGAWHWSDQINGGRDLTKCFDDMIVLSDNACGHALLDKIGFTNITNEARAIGCANTSFLGNDGVKTTAEDLALLLGLLQTNQILSQQSSRDILINAMKRNIYRQGIPAGENGTVANKVGFLDGLLHDAAIVYASTGPYVLVIMTNGSSWSNIAELTRQIEALRIQ